MPIAGDLRGVCRFCCAGVWSIKSLRKGAVWRLNKVFMFCSTLWEQRVNITVIVYYRTTIITVIPATAMICSYPATTPGGCFSVLKHRHNRARDMVSLAYDQAYVFFSMPYSVPCWDNKKKNTIFLLFLPPESNIHSFQPPTGRATPPGIRYMYRETHRSGKLSVNHRGNW